jgi:hypothetical protein
MLIKANIVLDFDSDYYSLMFCPSGAREIFEFYLLPTFGPYRAF